MNKVILILIAAVVIGAAAFSGFFNPVRKGDNSPAVGVNASCVDYDPPNTDDTLMLPSNGQKYNLIKDDARVIDDFKFGELRQIDIVDGKNVYNLESNIFYERITTDVIFILQNEEKPPKSPYIFKIYLRDGVTIPDYIKNCKSTPGATQVAIGNQNEFPPQAFNKTDIISLSDPSVNPAYVYNKYAPKESIFVLKNIGAKMIGSLKVAARNNKNLPLYLHAGVIYLADGNDIYQYLPTDEAIDLSSAKKSLQLKRIIFAQTPSYSWWTPSCKPAIYLYPQERENVNVKVNTTGFFTLTIPQYPGKTGWHTVANPNGVIEVNGISYPYLYYESKVPDSKITKPDKGFVAARNELPKLFSDLLPKLGLNSKESREFRDYWTKALPASPYYLVGVMSEESINQIEPLDINPKPDSIIRVRLYFELSDKPIQIDSPKIITPQRKGFTVVEWGGMIKVDKNSNFTCSQ